MTAAVLDGDFTRLPQYQVKLPATVRLQCVTTAQADRIDMLPNIQRLDGRAVMFSGTSMKEVMNAIVGIVGLGGTSY